MISRALCPAYYNPFIYILRMNKIDVSAIQGNPSKFYSTEHEDENMTKHSQEEQLESNIRPIHHSQSFSVDQNSFKRHAIFQQKEKPQLTKSDHFHPIKSKIYFKVPSIDDYYIRQSRENIIPNKLHRMESMIQTHNRDERPTSTPTSMPVEHKPSHSPNYIWGITGIVLGLLLLLWLYQQVFQS